MELEQELSGGVIKKRLTAPSKLECVLDPILWTNNVVCMHEILDVIEMYSIVSYVLDQTQTQLTTLLPSPHNSLNFTFLHWNFIPFYHWFHQNSNTTDTSIAVDSYQIDGMFDWQETKLKSSYSRFILILLEVEQS